MICSFSPEAAQADFEDLVRKTKEQLDQRLSTEEVYFSGQTGQRLETDVYETMRDLAQDTVFNGKIEKISGQKFPDIIAMLQANNGFGLEIKTSKQNHWTTTGNSIFEGTRVDGVNRIYLFFGKLYRPVEFRWALYEKCLSDVKVTHSPRYLIDMDVNPQENIFAKIGVDYESLRVMDNPFEPIKNYYRQNLRSGEEIWWIDPYEEVSVPLTIRPWNNLPRYERDQLRARGMAFFPQMFGNDPQKYIDLGVWLVNTQSIYCHNIRDQFTGGGQMTVECNGTTVSCVPKIFWHLQNMAHEVGKEIESTHKDILEFHWNEEVNGDKIDKWKEIVVRHSNQYDLPNNLDIKDLINENI